MIELEPERRTARRVRSGGQIPDRWDIGLETKVVQLSEGGMLLELPFRLGIGSQHRFSLDILGKEFQVPGTIRSSYRVSGGAQRYRVGIEFGQRGKREQRLIADFVAERLRGQ